MSKKNLEAAKESKDITYRTWLYRRKDDGSVHGEVFDAKVADGKLSGDGGWVFNPGELAEEKLQDDPQFQATSQQITNGLNFLENIDHVTSKEDLIVNAELFFGVKLDKRKSLKKLINEVKEIQENGDQDSD